MVTAGDAAATAFSDGRGGTVSRLPCSPVEPSHFGRNVRSRMPGTFSVAGGGGRAHDGRRRRWGGAPFVGPPHVQAPTPWERKSCGRSAYKRSIPAVFDHPRGICPQRLHAKQRLERGPAGQLAVLIHANPNESGLHHAAARRPDNMAVLARRVRAPARRSTSSPPPSNIRRCWDLAPNSNAKAWPSPAAAWSRRPWWIPRCGAGAAARYRS